MAVSIAPLNLVDVGCAGGLQEKWLPYVEQLRPILFDVNRAEAQKAREKYPNSVVVEVGLSNVDGPQNIFITRNHKCISIRQPNLEFLTPYRTKQAFEIIGRANIECKRYETLYLNGQVPRPDVIKLDVQGYEFEVLEGFGDLLHDCLAIELEAHFYHLYIGQRLLGDIVDFLQGFGFMLRRLEPSSNFDGDLVEVDAYFTKEQSFRQKLDSAAQAKCDLIAKSWKLNKY